MANRRFTYTPEFRGSFVIPGSAGATKWLSSDAEGKASWAEPTFVYERTFGLTGEAKAETLPRAYMHVKSGEKKKLILVRYIIDEGKEIKAELRRNGTSLEFGGEKELKLVSTELREKTSTQEISDKDYFDVVLKSPLEAPKIPQITLSIEVSF